MREKALSQVSQVTIGVVFWCDAFINLRDTDVLPRNIFAGEGSEHLPWCAPPADRENETVPLANTLTGRGSHKGRRPLRDRVGVIEYLDLVFKDGFLPLLPLPQGEGRGEGGI